MAATIRRLVMEEGYRYREISIICRDPERYYGSLDVALQKRDIPCFLSQPIRVEAEPVMRFALGAFEAVQSGFATDSLLSLLKTGLSGFTAEEISDLENYAFLWKVNGSAWREDFLRHPQGFGKEYTQADRGPAGPPQCPAPAAGRAPRPLCRPDQGRHRPGDQREPVPAPHPLRHGGDTARLLRRAGGGGGGGPGRPAAAGVWELLCQVLDQMRSILGDRKTPRERYYKLLREVVGAEDVSEIPQTVDQVIFGTAEQVRQSLPPGGLPHRGGAGGVPPGAQVLRRVFRRRAPGAHRPGPAPGGPPGAKDHGGAVPGLLRGLRPLGEAVPLLAPPGRGGGQVPQRAHQRGRGHLPLLTAPSRPAGGVLRQLPGGRLLPHGRLLPGVHRGVRRPGPPVPGGPRLPGAAPGLGPGGGPAPRPHPGPGAGQKALRGAHVPVPHPDRDLPQLPVQILLPLWAQRQGAPPRRGGRDAVRHPDALPLRAGVPGPGGRAGRLGRGGAGSPGAAAHHPVCRGEPGGHGAFERPGALPAGAHGPLRLQAHPPRGGGAGPEPLYPRPLRAGPGGGPGVPAPAGGDRGRPHRHRGGHHRPGGRVPQPRRQGVRPGHRLQDRRESVPPGRRALRP